MSNRIPPQIFHNKHDFIRKDSFVTYPLNLLAAINHKCTYNEQRVLLALLSCGGDGSEHQDIQRMLNITGIKTANHYFGARKRLEEKGYLTINNKKIYININKILSV